MFHKLKKVFGFCSEEEKLHAQRVEQYNREISDEIRIEKEDFVKANIKITHPVEIKPKDDIDTLCSKVGGKPFWPANIERPKCNSGHYLSFLDRY